MDGRTDGQMIERICSLQLASHLFLPPAPLPQVVTATSARERTWLNHQNILVPSPRAIAKPQLNTNHFMLCLLT